MPSGCDEEKSLQPYLTVSTQDKSCATQTFTSPLSSDAESLSARQPIKRSFTQGKAEGKTDQKEHGSRKSAPYTRKLKDSETTKTSGEEESKTS